MHTVAYRLDLASGAHASYNLQLPLHLQNASIQGLQVVHYTCVQNISRNVSPLYNFVALSVSNLSTNTFTQDEVSLATNYVTVMAVDSNINPQVTAHVHEVNGRLASTLAVTITPFGVNVTETADCTILLWLKFYGPALDGQ